MINFVVVDDNDAHRKNVVKIVMTNMMNNKIDFNIIEFNDYSKDLLKFISKNKKDCIYILDLELKSGDGIDVARTIRTTYNNWTCPIIIITAHTSLYYEVYKQRLQILDFIGKCENIKKNLTENINICLKMLNKEKVYRYSYRNVDYTIYLSEINYIQRDGRKTRIILSDKEYFQNISINEIIKSLPANFIISSKGTIINMMNVEKIDWSECRVYFKDGMSDYIVSKSHKKEIDNYELG